MRKQAFYLRKPVVTRLPVAEEQAAEIFNRDLARNQYLTEL